MSDKITDNEMDIFRQEMEAQMAAAEREEELQRELEELQRMETEEAANEEIPHNYNPIEENGPTQQDLLMWQKQYPNCKIFRVEIVDDMFVYRTLNRIEYKAIIAKENLNAVTREETIVRICCLYPEMDAQTMGEGPAGVVATLAQYIMRCSGFDEPQLIERLA